MQGNISNPKYSIVIPTRNRIKYLPSAIESVLSAKRFDIELIISNNHSTDGTDEYLASLNDRRIKLLSPRHELPMALHYEFALEHATGDWVTILGDDDSLMPYFFSRMDSLIRDNSNISIISSERAYYFWEGCEDLYGDSVVVYVRNLGARIRSTKVDLLAALAGLRSCFDLPQIYTTCTVKKSLIVSIKKKSGGKFYHSIIPDMYSAVSLSLAEDYYLRVEEPLFWTGTSSGSMGRSDRIYKDSELNDRNMLLGDVPLKLHSDIPQNLHILGIGSMYLYEAVLCCPFASGFWVKNNLSKLVYADLIKTVKNRSFLPQFTNAQIQGLIMNQLDRRQLSLQELKVIGGLVTILNIIQKITKIPGRVWRKIFRLIRKDTILSNDRARFETITKASYAVAKMLKET